LFFNKIKFEILVKDWRFLKFLIMGEPLQTTVNGGEPLQTAK
jgi:hypothetical protein